MSQSNPKVAGTSLLAVVVMVFTLMNSRSSGQPSTAGPTTAPFTKLDQEKLQNGHRVTEKIYSGAQPEGEASFAELQRLGIKTIISVDGAAPDVETAKKYGIRYVHMPIGYDSVPKEQGLALAKAISELPGPIYIHCHHGKHRSAAAVAVACVINGSLDSSRAEEVLRTFGTGANYVGLWESAREARPITPAQLNTIQVAYVEKAKIPPIADAMVHVDERSEHLKAIQTAGWKAPANHPDLNPPHEALLLQELLTELDRSDAMQGKPEPLKQKMGASATAAGALRTALLAQPFDPAAADTAMKAVATSCTACHAQFRD